MNNIGITKEQQKKINQLITCIALQYGNVTDLGGDAKMARLQIPTEILEQVKEGGCDIRLIPRIDHRYIEVIVSHDPDNPDYEPFVELE